MVTAAPAGGEARVVDSADLMPKVVDFLGVGDAFTPAVSKLKASICPAAYRRHATCPRNMRPITSGATKSSGAASKYPAALPKLHV